jgi:hypothetical protein
MIAQVEPLYILEHASNPIMEVIWYDHSGIPEGWTSIEEAMSVKPAECMSVGYLLKEDDEAIYIVQGFGMYKYKDPELETNNIEVMGVLAIHKRLIKSMKIIPSSIVDNVGE